MRIFFATLFYVFLSITRLYFYNNFGRDFAIIYLFIFLAISCAVFAKLNRRNMYAWFFIGLFSGMLGLAALLMIIERENKKNGF